MTKTITADLCVIGAGSGGLSVAAGAAMLGRKTVLIEKGEMGGDCLNTGCVPSKAFIAAAARAHSLRTSAKFGIAKTEPEIDFSAVIDHVHSVIDAIAPHDSQERFEGLGVTVLREHAEFTGARQVKAGPQTVRAKHFVVATGSAPFIPPVDGLDKAPYFTNETIFKNRTRPDHLIIIGGGPIGVELAQAHCRLGSKVTIVEGERILNRDDKDLAGIVRIQLEEDGVKILEGALARSVEETSRGIKVTLERQILEGSHLLVAAGRKPVVDGLNLAVANVEYDNKGIKTDARLRTSNKRIYAIGDVTGGRQFTHVAGYHASVIIRNILFKLPAKNLDGQAPWVTYCDPELAQTGLTEEQARNQFNDVQAVEWAFGENDRAQTERDTRGLIKAVTRKNGRILGASIVGRNAGDLIQLWTFAIANGRKIKDFTNFIAPYPTRGEASKRLAGQWYAPALFSKRTKMMVSLLSAFD